MNTTRPPFKLARRVALAHAGVVVAVAALALPALGCVTVKPQQRAILADPTMLFDDDARRAARSGARALRTVRRPTAATASRAEAAVATDHRRAARSRSNAGDWR